MAIDFDDFCQELAIDKTLLVHPAEIHGLGCGVLAAGYRLESRVLLQQINDYIGEEKLINDKVLNYFQESLKTLEGDSFEFQLCLPDDNIYALTERAQSLGAWCQGFLHGFATVQNPLSDEAHELLHDLTEISQLDASTLDYEGLGGDEEEENESHYTELTEFVRLAVISLFMDNNIQENNQPLILKPLH